MPNIRVAPLDERGPLHDGRTGASRYISIRGCECGYCVWRRADKRARNAAERELRNRRAPSVRSAMTVEQTREAKERLIHLSRDLGLSNDSIGRLAGIADSGVGRILRDDLVGSVSVITYSTYARIMAVNPDTAVQDVKALGFPSHGRMIANTGSVRRIRALQYNGFSLKAQARIGGLSHNTLKYVLCGSRSSTTYDLYDRIKAMYDKYAYADPGGGKSVEEAKARARREGWAPAACWDDDTIEDPDVLPEWTGFCSTTKGYKIHIQRDIPVCSACRQAYEKWHGSRSKG